MKSDRAYLEQMLDSAKKIRSFVNGFDHERFVKDQKTQSAVIMQMALIGELAKRVTEETRDKVALPWREITGFRDRAIHDYYQIDIEIVWTTIQEDISLLETALTSYFKETTS